MSDKLLVSDYRRISQDSDKLIVVTEPCGSGKTTSFLLDIASLDLDTTKVIIVTERKHQALLYQEKILNNDNIPKRVKAYNANNENSITIYNSDVRNNLKRKYNEPYLGSTISLITHARMWIDPPWLWNLSLNKENTTVLYVDETLCDFVRVFKISTGTLLDLINQLTGRPEDVELVKNNPYNNKSVILNLIEVVYRSFVNSMKTDKQAQNVLKAVMTVDSYPQVESMYKSVPGIGYFICLLTYGYLTKKSLKCDWVADIVPVSPLYLWSNAFTEKLIFDATGALFPYPDECRIMPSSYKSELNVFTVPISGDKRTHTKLVEHDPEVYYSFMKRRLIKLLTYLINKYSKIYVCTWKDKAVETAILKTSKKIDHGLIDELVTREYSLHELPDFSVTKALQMESLVKDIVKELNLEDKVMVTHYGYSRGSNDYIDCDCALLIGQFYYTKEVYNNLKLMSREVQKDNQSYEQYSGDPIPIVLSHSIQECYRTMARLRKDVDCYMCLDEKDSNYETYTTAIQDCIDRGYYFKSLNECPTDLLTDLESIQLKMGLDYILSLLTEKQKERMIKLLTRYPELKEKEIEINSKELSEIFECDIKNLSRDLLSISDRLNNHFKFKRISSTGGNIENVTFYKLFIDNC